MLELSVTVPAARVEEVLDVLALLAPHGVIERPADEDVMLVMRGAAGELPDREVVAEAAGAQVRERVVPEEWQQRRWLDVEPLVVDGRLAVRPEWCRPVPDVINVALGEGSAFGLGTHVTTEMCLDSLVKQAPGGHLADLGCGTGVLAVAAALLGWDPVTALDHDPHAVAEATANAQINGATIAVGQADLLADAPPPAEAVVANVPLAVHRALAHRLETPRLLIASGFTAGDAPEVATAYAACGLAVSDGMQGHGWAALTLRSMSCGPPKG